MKFMSGSAEGCYLGCRVVSENEKWLGGFLGFSQKCRSVSVGFEKKKEKKRKRKPNASRSVSRLNHLKKSTFERIQCACVGITCDDRIVWCQEQTKSCINHVGGTSLY